MAPGVRMGRQSKATWIDGGKRADVTLHLEAAGLQVRGERRADIPRGAWSRVEAEGGMVSFEADDRVYRFELGAAASVWAKALNAPLPSLAEKLGTTEGGSVAVHGDIPVTDLEAALADAARVPPWEADLLLVTVRTEPELDALPAWLRECGASSPVWIVHGKGRATTAPGDAAVRLVMRAAGYRDTKVSAIADEWSATRYSPAKA
jgi:hypothetical protein